MRNKTKLHLGCWKRYLPGFVHIDLCDMPHIDFKTNVNDLSMFGDETVDLIYASHVLEYFDRIEADKVLEEWHRVLKSGGILRLAMPNFEVLVEIYMRTNDLDNVLGPLYGRMAVENTGATAYHRTVYDFKSLEGILEKNHFGNVRKYRWQDTPPHDEVDDYSQAYFPHMDKKNGILLSLNVEADCL